MQKNGKFFKWNFCHFATLLPLSAILSGSVVTFSSNSKYFCVCVCNFQLVFSVFIIEILAIRFFYHACFKMCHVLKVSHFYNALFQGKVFSIWKLTDLHFPDKLASLFLFGEVHKEHWKTSAGAVVGLLNPSFLEARDVSCSCYSVCSNISWVMQVLIFT